MKKKISKEVYACKQNFFIISELRSEIGYVREILSNPSVYLWVGHIAHLVPRTPTFATWGLFFI